MCVRSCFMFEGMPKEVTQICEGRQEKFMTRFIANLTKLLKPLFYIDKVLVKFFHSLERHFIMRAAFHKSVTGADLRLNSWKSLGKRTFL